MAGVMSEDFRVHPGSEKGSQGPSDYVSREEIKALYRNHPGRILFAAVFTWGLILVSFWLWAKTSHVAALGVAFFVIATRQHALNNLVHEASHYNISRNKMLNDLISDILFAAPHLISTQGYKDKHLLHHAHLGNHRLDGEIKTRYLIRGRHFLRYTLASLTGLLALDVVRSYQPVMTSSQGSRVRYVLLVCLTNGALFGYCFWLGIPFAYFYLWVLPLFTLTVYLAMLRVVAEHQPEEYAELEAEDYEMDIKPPLTRTIPAGPIERFIFAPINFCYHNEHHYFPAVPFTQLPKLHRLLKERGYYQAHPECLGTSYRAVLKKAVFPDRCLTVKFFMGRDQPRRDETEVS